MNQYENERRRQQHQQQHNQQKSFSMTTSCLLIPAVFLVLFVGDIVPTVHVVSAFVPSSPLVSSNSYNFHSNKFNNNNNNKRKGAAIASSSASSSTLYAASKIASAIKLPTNVNVPNPFHKLPWNVDKLQKRKEWKLKLERSKLHRELGIAEDATYEQITEATEKMLALATTTLTGHDLMKRKIQIEVVKDQILQIRLNERLAGLMSDIVTKDAKSQSSFESAGNDLEDDLLEEKQRKEKSKEFSPPAWTKGLIVKPDDAQIKGQIRLWGILTAMGLALPPFINYSNRFTWLICIAQLSFRGMPKDTTEGGGVAMGFGRGSGGKSHIKVAWLIGLVVTFFGGIVTYSLMPSFLRGQKFTPLYAYAMRNFIFGVACCYFQPYKNK